VKTRDEAAQAANFFDVESNYSVITLHADIEQQR
jgi:hypothetical protein